MASVIGRDAADPRAIEGPEDLAPLGVDDGCEQSVLPVVGVGEQLERRAADDRNLEGCRQGLGGGHPDPQPGEQTGTDIDGNPADLLHADAGHAGERLDGGSQQLPVPASLADLQGRDGTVGAGEGHAHL